MVHNADLCPMRHLLLATLLLLGAGIMAQPNGSELGLKEFKRVMKKRHVLLVDVRTPGEFNAGHIEAAVNLDWGGGHLLADLSAISKTEPVLLYCGSGFRSGQAKQALMQAGFTKIYDLKGGMETWEAAKQPVITQ